MGPFTEGQVTTPDSVQPLAGPYQMAIDPKSGEIEPFDPDAPAQENTIRKYITVEAFDQDVPDDLPSFKNAYLVERSEADPIAADDTEVSTIKVHEIVRDNYQTATLECDPQDPPTTPQVEPPPVTPQEPECEKPHCDPDPTPQDCDPDPTPCDPTPQDCDPTPQNCDPAWNFETFRGQTGGEIMERAQDILQHSREAVNDSSGSGFRIRSGSDSIFGDSGASHHFSSAMDQHGGWGGGQHMAMPEPEPVA
ncbi:MAG: hypothetical protein HC848_09795 [Limnobacter sp.]|nr:hypothetical protein [Limnobacter sp.]